MSTLPNAPTIAPAEGAEYERDFYSWCLEQATLIRAGRLNAVDLENVAGEIESLGKEQFAKLRSAYRVLLLHMLKWEHQPERRSRSWLSTIGEQRARIEAVLEDSPSLQSRLAEAVEKGYRAARQLAAVETGLRETTFSESRPWSDEEIMTRRFEVPERD